MEDDHQTLLFDDEDDDEVPQESLRDDEVHDDVPPPHDQPSPPDSTPVQVQLELLLPPPDDEPSTAPPDAVPPPPVQPPPSDSTPVQEQQGQLELPLPDDEPSTAPPNDVQNPLEGATNLLTRARLVSDALFKEARDWPEFRRVLATPERSAQFESKLLAKAKVINSRLGTGLSHNALQELVVRLAKRLAAYEHSHERQHERQHKQVLKRREASRGYDMQIRRYYEDGESQRRIAARLKITRGRVEHVLERDAPHLLKRNQPPRLRD